MHFSTSYLSISFMYYCTFHRPAIKNVMYSYIISKTERDLVSTFASAYNNKHSITLYNIVNSSLGYFACPDDGLIRVKRTKHIVIHLTLHSIINFVVFDLHILYYLWYSSYNICSEGLFFWNAAFDITILDLISRVYHASFVIKLHQKCKTSPSSGCLWFTISCAVNVCHLILNTSVLINKLPFKFANR